MRPAFREANYVTRFAFQGRCDDRRYDETINESRVCALNDTRSYTYFWFTRGGIAMRLPGGWYGRLRRSRTCRQRDTEFSRYRHARKSRARKSAKRILRGSRCRVWGPACRTVSSAPPRLRSRIIGRRSPNPLLPIRNVWACHELSIYKKRSLCSCYTANYRFRYSKRFLSDVRFRYTFVTW